MLLKGKTSNGKDVPYGQGFENDKNTCKPSGARKGRKMFDMWAVHIFFLTFALSLAFSIISEVLLSKSNAGFAFLMLSVLIFFNIIADILAVAVTSCDITPFLDMQKGGVRGADIAVRLLRNAAKVNIICADVIGDISGIVSGALGATIVIKIFTSPAISSDTAIIAMLFSGLTAAFTVGGKAMGKKIAINKSGEIVLAVSKFFGLFRRSMAKKRNKKL